MLLDKPINSWMEKLPHWLLVASFAFPALPLNLSNIFFIGFSAFVILYWVFIRPLVIWKQIGTSVVLSLAFLPYIAEYVLHLNSGIMSFEVGKKLLFFLAPISIPVYIKVFKPGSLRPYFNSFCVALALLGLFSLAGLLLKGTVFNAASYANGAYRLRADFEAISNVHPTYFGFFAAIAIFWIISDYRNYVGKLKYVYWIFAVVLLANMVLIAAKMPLFILMAGSLWLFYQQVDDRKKLTRIYGAMILFSLIVMYTIPSMKSRMNEVTSYMANNNNTVNTLNQRELIFDCSKTVFFDNLFTGTGARNAQIALDSCYKSKAAISGLESYKYNSHNQFFTLGISYGLLVLVLFLCSIVWAIRQMKGFSFGVLMALSTCCIMLSESILERQMGIYFFLLFWLLAINQKAVRRKRY